MSARFWITLLLMTLATAVRGNELAEVQRLLRNGDTEAALRRAEQASAATPRDAALRFQLGVILLDLQRDVPAMDVFQRLTEDFPELPEPFNNIALLHARAGQLEQARQALEAALRNNPALVAARQNLGDIHLRLALQAWEAVALVLPADAALQRKLKLSRELLAAPLR